MRAAVYYSNGGPDVFRYEDVGDPVISDQEMLVKVEAISIEGGDTLNRIGGDLTSTPHIVGYQCAGTVIGVGDDVAGFAVGDRVVSLGMDGSHAELRAAHPAFTWKIPDALSTDVAACVPTAYGTAHDALFTFGSLKAGEVALIHAGASGVGIGAIQMAKQRGATVIATASSDARLARLTAYGLDHGINYKDNDFVSAVRDLTSGHGADVIVDSVGGSNLQGSLRCLAYRGRCITFGDAGRESTSSLDISTMRGNNQSLIGYFLGAELFNDRRAYAMIETIFNDVAAGTLEVVIDRRYGLDEAGEAHAYIESRQAFGRVILIPEG